MKASELRIGNWANDSAGKPFQAQPVDIVALKQIEVAGKTNTHYNDILLTESWLIKLGFKNERKVDKEKETDGIWEKNGVVIYQDYWINEDFVFATITKKEKFQRGFTIRYVHQLQNLFSALTQEQTT